MNQHKKIINLLFLGDYNTGKSTIADYLIQKLGVMDQGYLLKQQQAERERGEEIDLNMYWFETNKFICQIIDVQGHRLFIQNLITGISRVDIVILMLPQNQTHIQLIKNLGIPYFICLFNKMDQKTEQQYQEAVNQQNMLFQQAGYQNINIIPVSGLNGDNILEHNYHWYQGKTLIEALDDFPLPKDQSQLPLRVPIDDVYLIGGGVGTVPVGRVVSGILRKGIIAQFAPSGIISEINSIEMHGNILDDGLPGDMIGFSLKNIKINDIKKGYICSDAKNNPAKECKSFIAYIVITKNLGPISNGYNFIINCHSAEVPCIIDNIIFKTNRRTGEIIKYNPNQIRYLDCAFVKIIPTQPLSVEIFSEYPKLGRFIIKKEQQKIGYGIIIQIEQIKS